MSKAAANTSFSIGGMLWICSVATCPVKNLPCGSCDGGGGAFSLLLTAKARWRVYTVVISEFRSIMSSRPTQILFSFWFLLLFGVLLRLVSQCVATTSLNSICRPGWSQTHRNVTTCTSRILGLKVYATHHTQIKKTKLFFNLSIYMYICVCVVSSYFIMQHSSGVKTE